MIRIKFLEENKTDNPGCLAEHGLSILIETEELKILFDAGASPLFTNNAEYMKTDLKDVDALVISHGHYDHTGGVPAFCRLNEKAPVCVHKNAFKEIYSKKNGQISDRNIGIRWTKAEYEEILPRLLYTNGVLNMGDNVWISGTIPDVEGIVPSESFYEKNEDGELVVDNMSHEQFLAVRNLDEEGNSKGIYIFSGCSHKGIIPVINYARELFPDEKIAGLIAGMHLYSADENTIERVINQVMEAGVDMVMPVHCTGINAICSLKQKLGDNCIVATCGDTYEF